jgi:hypothetical protein
MSNPTDQETAAMWVEERQSVQDAMRAAGISTPKPVLQGEAE